MSKVITRFAPSPTNPKGEGLHVGGLRTVLFNYALRHQSKDQDSAFILRCEDTDQQRSNDQCLKSIIQDLNWMGISFDAGFKIKRDILVEFNNTKYDLGPLRQSNRLDIYNKYIDILLNKKMAYEKDGAIWFNMPKDAVSFQDQILGNLTLPKEDCQDFIIRKSSGIPSFYFAVSIDDAVMGVTHVVRGQEHINTAYRQIALQKALGFEHPIFAHIPLIMNPDGSKMSKRQAKGNINTDDFRRDGYLRESLLNYLVLLGWSHPEGKEDFTFAEFIEKFNISDICKSNARFDYKKLENFNSKYLKNMDAYDFYRAIHNYGHIYHREAYDKIPHINRCLDIWGHIVPLYQNRCKTLKDFYSSIDFFIIDEIMIAEDAKNKVLNKKSSIMILEELLKFLRALTKWSKENIHDIIYTMSTNLNVKIGDIAQPLRVAVTGTTVSPPIDDTLYILGKDKTLARISDCISQITLETV